MVRNGSKKMKYVVKNCSAYKNMQECADCTDCVMKQIVEECKKAKSIDCVYQRDKRTGEAIGVIGYEKSPNYEFADKLLQLLHIEDVE